MLSRLIKAAVIAAVLALVIDSLPDIKRYLELREMLSARTGEEVMGVEVVLGFVVGYLVGTRQGREGLQKALDSAQAIMASDETRRLLGEGLAALESVTAPVLDRVNGKSNGKAALFGTVLDEVLERRQARRAALSPGSGMHEYGLCEGVLETVRQRADGRQVAGIRVRFGVRHAVAEESLAQAFSFVAAGTEAAGAVVELVTVPATIDCRDCGLLAETTDVLAVCPRCGGDDVAISGGDEMTLESITYERAP
jgi:hydrogenase nickel incorporation protein HypA/HybF